MCQNMKNSVTLQCFSNMCLLSTGLVVVQSIIGATPNCSYSAVWSISTWVKCKPQVSPSLRHTHRHCLWIVVLGDGDENERTELPPLTPLPVAMWTSQYFIPLLPLITDINMLITSDALDCRQWEQLVPSSSWCIHRMSLPNWVCAPCSEPCLQIITSNQNRSSFSHQQAKAAQVCL